MFQHLIQSLSLRLWLTTILALAISLIALASALIYAFDHYPEQTLGQHEQMENVRRVIRGIRFDSSGRTVSVILPADERSLFRVAPKDLRYRVLSPLGQILLASTKTDDDTPWLNRTLSEVNGQIIRTDIAGRPFFVATQKVQRSGSGVFVQTATSARFISALVNLKVSPIPAVIRITLIVATILFGLLLPLTIYRVLKPLRDASGAASRITPRRMNMRLSNDGVPSEIKPLINAFNEALSRLEKGFRVQQQFLADAAHELQTPLTLIRGQIELQPEINEKDLLFREIDLMSRQVRQLLHLAEVSEVQNFNFVAVNLSDVAYDVVAYLARRAHEKYVTLHVEESGTPPCIQADGSALFILLKNIIENAINASPVKGMVTLTIDSRSIGIRDEGPGISEEHQRFLFKRFWRAPGAKYHGAGLGLAICHEIAVAHSWRLTVDSLDKGTRFSLWI